MKKNYAKMSFGQLMVASSQAAAAIARGEVDAARVSHVTARDATVRPPPAYYQPERVKAVRQSLGLSQPVFAKALNVSAATVRGWEQGARHPNGPTQRLLEIAERHPQAVLEHVRSGRRRLRPGTPQSGTRHAVR